METNLLHQASSRYRLAIISRVAAAIIGGYIFTSGCILFLPFLLPGQKASVILEATLLSFLFYTGAIIWAFSARTISKAWTGLLMPGIILIITSMVFKELL